MRPSLSACRRTRPSSAPRRSRTRRRGRRECGGYERRGEGKFNKLDQVSIMQYRNAKTDEERNVCWGKIKEREDGGEWNGK